MRYVVVGNQDMGADQTVGADGDRLLRCDRGAVVHERLGADLEPAIITDPEFRRGEVGDDADSIMKDELAIEVHDGLAEAANLGAELGATK